MGEIGSIFFNLFVITFLLLANAFFVASEFALVSVRKTRITQLSKEGDATATIALNALLDIDKFIAAVQLGITISSIGLGWVGEATLVRMIEPLFEFLPSNVQIAASHTISFAIAFALITILHVVIGELMPKSIALQYPERTTLVVARPMQIITKLFTPFIFILNGFGNFLLKMLKIPAANTSHLVHSTEELNMLIDASYNQGVLNETEKEMITNVFKFSDLSAKQVMIPRTDMVCVSNDVTFDELKALTTENEYTRYPVYEENLDHISGIIHVKDLYSISINNEDFSMEKLLRPVLLVPETITMDLLLRDFKKEKAQMAIVIDEFGGTAGLVTLEDVLEEICGEVQDEFDEEEAEVKLVGENTYIANAIVRLDEFCEFLEIDEIEDEDIDTIGGFVVKLLGKIADINDSVTYQNLEFCVKEVDGARITKLIVVKKPVNVNFDENN